MKDFRIPSWEVEADEVDCFDTVKPICYMSDKLRGVIHELCDVVEVEWQIFCTGTIKDNQVWLKDYWIPRQKVTCASVENLENLTLEESKKYVAIIHSHGNMAVFFSQVDRNTINTDIPAHIVVNNKGEYKGVMNVKLPCGKSKVVDMAIKFTVPMIENVKGIDKIQREVYKGGFQYDLY